MPDTKNSVGPVSRRVLRSEFCQYFLEHSNSLYLLALMLTANTKLAEKCFTKAFDDCLNATGVSKGWERTWARRTVICNAIELSGDALQHSATPAGGQSQQDHYNKWSSADSRLAIVMALPPFERFVFVMSVLESYSDQECRILLKCLKQEIVDSRLRALKALSLSARDDQSTETPIHQLRTQYSAIEIGAMEKRFTEAVETLSPIGR